MDRELAPVHPTTRNKELRMTTPTYDLITLGGGIAGAATAASVARSGARVLVIEREAQFHDRVRGEWLAPWGVAEARALGLLPAFAAAGAIRLPALAGRSLKPRRHETPDGEVALSFHHPALQAALLAFAEDAGATVLRPAEVTKVIPGSAPAVEYRTAGGTASASARLIVGADGRGSLARKAAGGRVVEHRSERPLAGVRLAGVTADPSFGYFIIREDQGSLASLFPQADGFARAYVFHQGRTQGSYSGADGFGRFIDDLVAAGVPRAVVAHATPAGPLASFLAADSWVEHPANDGVVLVGDAAGISDPTWGMGIALALADARCLAGHLARTADWCRAADDYARERTGYFSRVITAERWQTELQFEMSSEAVARRHHALRLWRDDPNRALDLPGIGPGVDVSEASRVRFFGDDVAMGPPQVPPLETGPLGDRFIAALGEGALGLGRFFTADVRMRALLPRGPIELHGAEEAASAFERWFGSAVELKPVESAVDEVADRLQLRWRFFIRWEGEPFLRMIEQTAYAKLVEGRIAVLDLVCSGFRPMAVPLDRAA
jgi:menaquinone-9 beta-reductase